MLEHETNLIETIEELSLLKHRYFQICRPILDTLFLTTNGKIVSNIDKM